MSAPKTLTKNYMRKKLFFLSCFILGILILPLKNSAQEFPVTSSTNVSMLGEVGFDGTNYLFGFAEDSTSMVAAQFVSTSGGLVGAKILLGYRGGAPLLEFDGTNYLFLWSGAKQVFNPDKTMGDTIFGQFISPSGSLVGNRFIVATNASISNPKGGCIDFNNGVYMVIFKQNDINYALTISPSGIISSPIQLSSITAGDNAMAFDGTNYLVTWWSRGLYSYDYEQDIYGQFISSTGSLVGSTFIIDDDDTHSDNPLSMAFDGTKYMVTFHVSEANIDDWNLYSRFVSTSGVVDDRIILRDYSYKPSFGYTSFDGTNYLVTWADSSFSLESVIKGRYYNTNGQPLDNNIFTIFTSLNGDIPMYAGHFFTNNKFLVVAFRMNTSNFQYGDIYGAFIPSSTSSLIPIDLGFDELTIYPNPAKDIINIDLFNYDRYQTLNIYNIMGVRVITHPTNQKYTQVDVSKLSNGVYFIELSDGYNKKVQKLVIKR